MRPWHGAAFDPDTQRLYVPSITAPFVADIEPRDPEFTGLPYVKGRQLWEWGDRGVGRCSNGAPMTDMHDGRQYLVVATGSIETPAE